MTTKFSSNSPFFRFGARLAYVLAWGHACWMLVPMPNEQDRVEAIPLLSAVAPFTILQVETNDASLIHSLLLVPPSGSDSWASLLCCGSFH